MANKHTTSAGAGAHDGTSLANAYSWAEFITAINAATGGGDDWYLYGAFSRTTTVDTISVNAPASNPHRIIGCASTPGDAFTGYNAYGFLDATNFSAITYTTGRLIISGDYVEVHHLNGVGAPTGAGVITMSGFGGRVFQCRVENTHASGATAGGVSLGDASVRCVDCDIIQSGSGGTNPGCGVTSVNAWFDSCRIKSLGGPGCYTTYAFGLVTFSKCVFYECGTNGFEQAATASGARVRLDHCTFYQCAAAGVKLASGYTGDLSIEGCAFILNGTYGVDANGATCYVMLDQNYYDGNVTAPLNVSARAAAMETRAVTTAGPKLVNEANNDLRPLYGSPLLAATRRGIGIGALGQRPEAGLPAYAHA